MLLVAHSRVHERESSVFFRWHRLPKVRGTVTRKKSQIRIYTSLPLPLSYHQAISLFLQTRGISLFPLATALTVPSPARMPDVLAVNALAVCIIGIALLCNKFFRHQYTMGRSRGNQTLPPYAYSAHHAIEENTTTALPFPAPPRPQEKKAIVPMIYRYVPRTSIEGVC